MNTQTVLRFEADWYENLLSTSTEKVKLISKLYEIIENKKFRSIIEVGMGTTPIFAQALSSIVTRYLIVEKENYLTELPENVEFLNDCFEGLDLSEKFDAAILSHVIYYFNDLREGISKSLMNLNPGGSAFFVVNGPGHHYGPLKEAFSCMASLPNNLTYYKLLKNLENKEFFEHTLDVEIPFDCYEKLYESLRLFFDLSPREFIHHKREIIDWLKINVPNGKFIMEQKILEVFKR